MLTSWRVDLPSLRSSAIMNNRSPDAPNCGEAMSRATRTGAPPLAATRYTPGSSDQRGEVNPSLPRRSNTIVRPSGEKRGRA